MGDVVVFGLDSQTVPLDDIMMDVPHARTVTIPEARALQSKDLWRAISQKRIFQLDSKVGPTIRAAVVGESAQEPSDVERLEEQLRELGTASMALRKKYDALREEHDKLLSCMAVLEDRCRTYEAKLSEAGKLDEILQLLRDRPVWAAPSLSINKNGGLKTTLGEGVVEVDAPAFVPGEIRPKDVETRVEVSSETSHGGSVSGASEALRRRRQGQ